MFFYRLFMFIFVVQNKENLKKPAQTYNICAGQIIKKS